LGIENGLIRVHDVYQMLGWVEPEVIERLHIDTVYAPRLSHRLKTRLSGWTEWQLLNGERVLMPEGFQPELTPQGDWIITDSDGSRARMPKEGYYFDYLEDTFSDKKKDIDKLRFGDWSDEEYRFCGEQAERLFKETDKALIGDFGVNLGRSGSYENWFVLLALEPSYMKEYHDKKSDHIVGLLIKYKQAMGDRISALYFGQDFGTQNGEMISPDMFRELFVPYFKKVFSWIHENTPWKVFFHCCGSIYHIIPHFIEAGVDILNPVQCSAVRMDPAVLKREFGEKLVFWGGGVDTQSVLPFGTVEEVRSQVKERIDTFKGNGGFVFNPVHNIQHGVPAENIIASFDAAYEFGRYT
ncbi:MAG TPA: uroporphyrinogen decarboxylase family protein, partial [Spirochaetia bacterium]|nr:uroporphyrinogen decarboxylase family protein [Spirochaetia bacterium]